MLAVESILIIILFLFIAILTTFLIWKFICKNQSHREFATTLAKADTEIAGKKNNREVSFVEDPSKLDSMDDEKV